MLNWVPINRLEGLREIIISPQPSELAQTTKAIKNRIEVPHVLKEGHSDVIASQCVRYKR